MFERLNNTIETPAVENQDFTPDGISFDLAFELEADSAMQSFLNTSDESEVQEETLTNLAAFKSAVEQFGLTRALLAFADHNKSLSSSVSGVPSVEALSADLSVDESAVAIEGIGTTIKSVAKAYFAGLAYSITHPFMNYSFSQQAEYRITVWKHLIDGIEKNMSEMDFSKEKAEKIYNRTVPFEALVKLQKAYSGAPKAVLALWTTELPKKEEEYGPWLAKVKSTLEPIFITEEATIKDNGSISVPLKRWFILKTDTKRSLVEKGYDSEEKVKEVISGFRNILQAHTSVKTILNTVKANIEKQTKEGEEFDRAVVNRAVSVGKNLTKALLTHGLWGVSGMSMFTISGLKKAFVKKGYK